MKKKTEIASLSSCSARNFLDINKEETLKGTQE